MQKKRVMASAHLKASLMHNPFDRLKGLVDRKDLPPSRPPHQASLREKERASDPQPEEQLFLEAMAGVNPIARDQVVEEDIEMKVAKRPKLSHENEALSRL